MYRGRRKMRIVRILAIALICIAAADAQSAAPPSCGKALNSAAGRLPVAQRNGYCGAAVAVCPEGQCCDQYGRCSSSNCLSTCQCEYSGKNSSCPGNPWLSNDTIPVAPAASLCGPGVATCPDGYCCSKYGFCGKDIHCALGCSPQHSGNGSDCKVNPNAKTVRYNLTVQWLDLAPDGYTRPVMAVNGGVEGPVLTCNVGDRIVVTVDNRLDQPLALHWHGMLHRGTNIFDGVAGVTQRGIRPNSTQLYDFECVTSGTYWYHSHYKTQYIDGVRGPLVIYDPTAPKPEAESVMTVADWYHMIADAQGAFYLSATADGYDPIPVTGLINGIGQGDCRGSACPYAVVKAAPGSCEDRKTKIRIINMSAFTSFTVAIDGHSMVVVGVDAVAISPSRPLKAVRLNVAQRLDVVVCRDSGVQVRNASAPAWIRAELQRESIAETGESRQAQHALVLGVLQYGPASSKPRELPTTQPDANPIDLLLDGNAEASENPYDYVPIDGATPPPSTHNFSLLIDFSPEPSKGGAVYAHFNSISFQPPDDGGPRAPSLIEIAAANQPLPADKNMGFHTETVPKGAVVDIIVNNPQPFEHPLHIHGHWAWVMWRGLPDAGFYNPETDQLDPTPFLRDTATINQNSSIVLRFVANNPGIWLFHCHIDWHLLGGLALAIRYGVGADAPVYTPAAPTPAPSPPSCIPGPVRGLKGTAVNSTALSLNFTAPTGSCDLVTDGYWQVEIFDLSPAAAQAFSSAPPLILSYSVAISSLPVVFNFLTPGHLYRADVAAVSSFYNAGPVSSVQVQLPGAAGPPGQMRG